MSADKSYQMTPIGNEVARYLRTKRMRLTDSSYHSYEFCLEKFVRHCTQHTTGGTAASQRPAS